MRAAICLSGQPRILNETYENHKTAILDKKEFDLFIHGWWSNEHQGKTKLFHSIEKFPHSDLSLQYVDAYRPKNFLFEDYKDFDLKFCKQHDYGTWENCTQKHYDIFTPSLLYGQLSQSQSIKDGVLLACNSGKYEFIVRTRPDVFYTKDILSIMQSISPKDDEIYFQSSMSGGHIYSGEFPNNPCDWFFCGSPNSMTKFVEHWHPTIKDYYSTGVKHVRDTVRKVAEKANLRIVLVDFGVLVYRQLIQNTNHRPVTLYYEEFDSDLLQVVKNHDEWPHWYTKIDFKFLRNT